MEKYSLRQPIEDVISKLGWQFENDSDKYKRIYAALHGGGMADNGATGGFAPISGLEDYINQQIVQQAGGDRHAGGKNGFVISPNTADAYLVQNLVQRMAEQGGYDQEGMKQLFQSPEWQQYLAESGELSGKRQTAYNKVHDAQRPSGAQIAGMMMTPIMPALAAGPMAGLTGMSKIMAQAGMGALQGGLSGGPKGALMGAAGPVAGGAMGQVASNAGLSPMATQAVRALGTALPNLASKNYIGAGLGMLPALAVPGGGFSDMGMGGFGSDVLGSFSQALRAANPALNVMQRELGKSEMWQGKEAAGNASQAAKAASFTPRPSSVKMPEQQQWSYSGGNGVPRDVPAAQRPDMSKLPRRESYPTMQPRAVDSAQRGQTPVAEMPPNMDAPRLKGAIINSMAAGPANYSERYNAPMKQSEGYNAPGQKVAMDYTPMPIPQSQSQGTGFTSSSRRGKMPAEGEENAPSGPAQLRRPGSASGFTSNATGKQAFAVRPATRKQYRLAPGFTRNVG